MKAASAAVLLGVLATPGARAAGFGPPNDPDWPCQAIKVPELSIASLWGGPPIGQYEKTWSQDPAVAELAARLAERRVPLDKAEAAIGAFAKSVGDDRKPKLLALLAGLFENLNGERSSVIAGLDRFGARQIELADQIRSQLDTLHALQAKPNPDTQRIVALGDELHWEVRTFEQRRQMTQYVCAVPDKIEHRLFALARAVQQNLG